MLSLYFNRKKEVNITRLDDEEFDRSKFNFINIDVQGYELEVFKGATKTLESIDLILAEINKEEMYKDCVWFIRCWPEKRQNAR